MIEAAGGATFDATAEATPGIAGTLGVRILDTPGNNVVLARQTVGIVEAPPGSGIYAVTLTAPLVPGRYSIVWDDGSGNYGEEDLVVGAATSAPASTVVVVVAPTPGEGRTFRELQDEALADDFDPSKYRARVQTWMNEAQRYIFRRTRVPEGEWTEEITTAAGQPTLTPDASVIRVNSLRNTADRTPLTEVAIESIDSSPSSTGKPSQFARIGKTIVLYPTPDSAYALELRYQSRPNALTADGDEPLLQADYQDLLVTYARSRLFRAEDDPEMATFYMNEFETGVLRMSSDVARGSRGRRRQVPGMYAGSSAPTFVRPSR